MKYQYNPQSSQSQSKLKPFLIRLFVFISLFGALYQGYKFFQSLDSKKVNGPDQYCGNSTCYQLLNVQRDASDDEIKKSYRLLARKYHPDKSKQNNAVEIFQLLNKAYQTLSDQKQRFLYNLYLSNPSQSQYSRQFEYYNKKYISNPHIPVPYVIIGIILCISLLQYVMRKQMYQKAIERIIEGHDFKIKVNQRFNQLNSQKNGKGSKGNIKNSKYDKYDKQKVKEDMIKEIEIEGGLSKPQFKDIFGYKLIISPYTFCKYIISSITWFIKYTLLKKQYSQQAKHYLTQKSLSISDTQWKNMQQTQKILLISKQLWIQKNKKQFIRQKRQQWLEGLKVTNPNKYNMVIKYMAKHKIQ